MKRKDLRVGQKYSTYSNNKDSHSAYLATSDDDDGEVRLGYNNYIVEVVDVGYFRTQSYWFGHPLTLEQGLAKKQTGIVSAFDYQGVLVKIIEGASWRPLDPDRPYRIAPLSMIREPFVLWKRRGSVQRIVARREERKRELAELVEKSKNRHWNKKIGKKIRNKIKKLERKAGIEHNELVVIESWTNNEGLDRVHQKDELVNGRSWGESQDYIKISYQEFLKLLDVL